MKLLDRNSKNKKIEKTQSGHDGYHFAGLSLLPTLETCINSITAGCFKDCLKSAGMAGVFKNINLARQAKTDLFLNDPEKFMAILRRELTNYIKWCEKNNLIPVVRLNVLSDILWEEEGIVQEFPQIQFYDYTKIADRFYKQLPSNYQLIFSYSGKPSYKKEVEKFLASGSDAPIAVVFNSDDMPDTFLGRKVINGDDSDWINAQAKNKVVGLIAKGKAKKNKNKFVVDTRTIIDSVQVLASKQ
jgi:hypothetical protein